MRKSSRGISDGSRSLTARMSLFRLGNGAEDCCFGAMDGRRIIRSGLVKRKSFAAANRFRLSIVADPHLLLALIRILDLSDGIRTDPSHPDTYRMGGVYSDDGDKEESEESEE